MDTEAVHKRLVARDTVVPASAASTLNVARAYTALQNEESDVGVAQAHNVLLKELARVELDYAKLAVLLSLRDEESKHYLGIEKEIEKKTQEANKDIADLRSRLAEAQLVRQRKEELEMLAMQVNSERPRVESEKEIAKLERELAGLQEKLRQVDEQFNLRQRQFQLLLHSVAELNSELSGKI
jgi:hypothetical protein